MAKITQEVANSETKSIASAPLFHSVPIEIKYLHHILQEWPLATSTMQPDDTNE